MVHFTHGLLTICISLCVCVCDCVDVSTEITAGSKENTHAGIRHTYGASLHTHTKHTQLCAVFFLYATRTHKAFTENQKNMATFTTAHTYRTHASLAHPFINHALAPLEFHAQLHTHTKNTPHT